jgi:transposase
MARRKIKLTDEQWSMIEPLLRKPRTSKKGGRPRISDRDVIDGILWILRTGAPWRDLPERYPSPSTCWRRLRQWEEDDTWLNIWRSYLGQLDVEGILDWEECFIDASFIPAKKGAPKSAKPSGARAQSVWWWSTARVYLWEFPLPRRHQRKSLLRRMS